MNYEETLNKVECFMDKSGIREFCSDVCQGYCCGNCYLSENACHKNEGRRLSCSVFICGNLSDLLFNSEYKEAYAEMENMIIHKLRISSDKVNGKNRVPDSWIYQKIYMYYRPHSKKMRDEFLIEDKFLNILDKIDISMVKRKLTSIKNMHVVLSRFFIKELRSKHGAYGTIRRK